MQNNKPISAKTFAQAIWELKESPQLLNKFLKDKRPTFQEKIIIESLVLLRDNEFKKIEVKLKGLSLQDPFVDAIRNLILGISYNNAGNFTDAENFLCLSHETLLNYDARPLIMLACFNEFICKINLQKLDDSRELKNQILKFKAKNPKERLIQLLMACTQSLYEGNPDGAEKYLQEIEDKKNTLSESDKAGFFYDKFLYYLLKKNMRAARDLLDEMKSIKKFYHSPNYNFMKGLLDFLIDEKVFYFYEDDFKDAMFLWWQLSVLQKLEERDRQGAQLYWNKLAQISPNVYSEDFNYKGSFCLFQLALKKVYYSQRESLNSSPMTGTKEEQITKLLHTSSSGMRKDELYLLIYGSEATTKEDFNKLKTAIMRVRKKSNIDIKTKKGCYFIPPKKNIAS